MMDFAKKLCRATELGFKRLEMARKTRYMLYSQLCGRLYSKQKMGGGQEERKASPINLIYNGVTTLVPNLCYNDPKVMVGTPILPYRDYANSLKLAENHLLKKIQIRKTLRKVITDAIMCCGVIKTGIGVSDQTLELDGRAWDLGQLYVERVDLDDFVFDPMARDQEEWSFVGNRVRLPKDLALQSGLFDNAALEKLCSRYKEGQYRNEVSNLSGDGRVAETYQEIIEYIDLVEVYLPTEQIIVTIPYGDYGGDKSIIRTADYNGPEKGPYHLLGFTWIADNVLPVPPAGIWYDLHTMGNRIARKIGKQAERMKTVLAYESNAIAGAKQIVEAEDGETIEVDDVDKIKEVSYGGTTPEAYQYLAWVQQEFSKIAGNIDLLGGIKSDEDTATQAQIVQGNAQVKLQDMQELVYQFTADVCRDVGFFLHTDPLIDLTLAKRVNGQDMQVRYTPEMREGDFFDYTFSVKPYSMGRRDPEVVLKKVMEFISNGVPAIAQAAQLLGPGFKVENAINLVLEKMGLDEDEYELIDSQLLMQHMQMQMQAVPPDGKAPGAPQSGAQIGQPNPMARMPNGGAPSAQTEFNQQAQATAAVGQQQYTAGLNGNGAY